MSLTTKNIIAVEDATDLTAKRFPFVEIDFNKYLQRFVGPWNPKYFRFEHCPSEILKNHMHRML
jgi:hypothetical protein